MKNIKPNELKDLIQQCERAALNAVGGPLKDEHDNAAPCRHEIIAAVTGALLSAALRDFSPVGIAEAIRYS